jgi:hypothetical protein
MDNRWTMDPLDSTGAYRLFLQPTATIDDVRSAQPKDQWEITPWVSAASQSASEMSITIDFDSEFYGSPMPTPTSASVLVNCTGDAYATCGPGVVNNATATVDDDGNGAMDVTGVYPPVNVYEGVNTMLTYGSGSWPELPAGAVVTSIEPVVVYELGYSSSPGTPLAFNVSGVGMGSSNGAGEYVGASIGTTEADFYAFTCRFQFEATAQLSNYTGRFVCSVFLRVSYTAPTVLTRGQPFSQQVVNLMCKGMNLWIGLIESISSYTLASGVRRMTLTCRTRETQDIWKLTKYSTQLYPQNTNLQVIINDVATQVGLPVSAINVPPTSVTTAHSNTQLAGVSAWEMMQTLFLPLGQTPIVNAVGILKGVSKDLWGRSADIVYDATRIVSVGATRNRPPATRYVLQWLDPNLSKAQQVERKLADVTLTAGYFTPILWKHVTFSPDGTQRAENTYLVTVTSVNQFRLEGTTIIPCFVELWNQDTDIDGRLMIVTLGWDLAALYRSFLGKGKCAIAETTALQTLASAQAATPFAGAAAAAATQAFATAKNDETILDLAIFLLMSAVGTGVYEIWGNPFDYVHARNTSEAYAADVMGSVPWADNPKQEECDLIMDESHAQAVCTRELVYQAAEANSWTLKIADDKRIEKGDLLQFPDGSQVYVLDFTRSVGPYSDNVLEVKGFLVSQGSTA